MDGIGQEQAIPQPLAPMTMQDVWNGARPAIPTGPNTHEQVNIQKVTNGFIVNVGCKTFVADCFEKVSKGLELFYKDRTKAIKEYLDKQ